ncbi:outer membrane protein assembly factor BamB family protein [Natronoarchaeum rubrum]|uniref:outer membrane protein assembly factor BamB family protein n=1 Tax=Natronoarchaeum rubrum TaxID=755311 RepID=UPI002112E163|nr:PQQ-binding-like beta-propeller repeat protein [Natronoarchaeum rubrum]
MVTNIKHARRAFLSLIAGSTLAGTAGASAQTHRNPSPSTEQPTSIEQVVQDQYTAVSLVTDVSASGDTVLFGFDNGDLVIYDPNRQSEIFPFSVNSGISHIQIEEATNTAALAWMDADLYGSLDLTSQDGPVVEHPGLWDIAMASEDATMASVSSPIDGQGSVILATEDGQQWRDNFDEAAANSVDITADGDSIAVGGTHYWVGATEREGTPGVMLYDSEGEQQWVYETELDVIATQINAESECVVAGTEDGQIFALDLDGELRWEDPLAGGWPYISRDGSTVITSTIEVAIQAYDSTTGEELWSTEIGAVAGEDISVTEDGTRVLASARTEGEIYVVEESGVIWENAYDVGPAVGALSGTGGTWSVGIQQNEEQTGRVEIYEDSAA